MYYSFKKRLMYAIMNDLIDRVYKVCDEIMAYMRKWGDAPSFKELLEIADDYHIIRRGRTVLFAK